jgi:hypothetical protein
VLLKIGRRCAPLDNGIDPLVVAAMAGNAESADLSHTEAALAGLN